MNNELRKAAVLIASLDRRDVDVLLENMPEELALQVRQAAIELEEISPDEQAETVRQFMQHTRGETGAPNPKEATDVPMATNDLTAQPETDIRDAWKTTPIDTLQRVLMYERPLIVAVVMSQLEADRALSLLAKFPSSQQDEIVAQMAELEKTCPDVLVELIHEISQQAQNLEPLMNPARAIAAAPQGIESLKRMIDAADGGSRHALLQRLSHANAKLASNLANTGRSKAASLPADRRLTIHVFEEVLELECRSLCDLLRQCGLRRVAFAIACDPAVREKMIANLPEATGAQLAKQARMLAEVPPEQTIAARREILHEAAQMIARGQLRFQSPESKFTVSA